MFENKDLSEAIYIATKEAVSELYMTNEKFYFIVLVFTGNDYDPFISSWSEEALKRELNSKPSSFNINDISGRKNIVLDWIVQLKL